MTETLDTLRWLGGHWLLEVSVRVTLLLLAAIVVCVLLRRASAAARHALWSVELAAALALPIAAAVVPAWYVPLFRAGGTADAHAEGADTVLSANGLHGRLAQFAVEPHAIEQSGAEVLPSRSSRAATASTGAAASSEGTGERSFGGSTWLFAAWLVGMVAMLSYSALGLVGARRTLRGATPIRDARWTALVEVLRAELGVAAAVTLRRMPLNDSPKTWHWFGAVVLLPADCEGWCPQRRRIVLLHELAHVRRRDAWTRQLAQLARSVYWFHPLVWLSAGQLRKESERAADDLVLAAAVSPGEYAKELLDITRGLAVRGWGYEPAPAMARRSQLEGRLRAILDRKRCRTEPSKTARRAVALIATGVLLAAATVQPWTQAMAAKPTGGPRGAVGALPGGEGQRTDLYGDALPEGALLRLGTLRLRQRQGALGVAFTPDGSALASTGWGAAIHLWDAGTGKLVQRYTGSEPNGTFAVAFSPDGTKMASVGGGGLVRLWDVSTGKELWKATGHRDRVYGVAFAPDGLTFATVGEDGLPGTESSVRLWDAAGGEELLVIQTERVSDAAGVVFSPDGKILAAGAGKKIHLWDIAEGTGVVIDDAHGRAVRSIAFMPNGRHLVSGGNRRERETNAAGRSFLRRIPEIRFWEAATGAQVREIDAAQVGAGGGPIALSRDGKLLVSGHSDAVAIWDAATGKLLRRIEDSASAGDRTHELAISPDNKRLATRRGDNRIRLWETQTGKPLFDVPSHNDAVVDVSYTPDTRRIVTASLDGAVRVWDATSAASLLELATKASGVQSVAVSREGRIIVAGGEAFDRENFGFYGVVNMFDAGTGKKGLDFTLPQRLTMLCLSPDGKRLAAAAGLGFHDPDRDGSGPVIYLCDAQTGKQTAVLLGHVGRIVHIQFSGDGATLISVAEDSSLRVWDVAGAEQLNAFDITGHERRDQDGAVWSTQIDAAALTPDLSTAVTAGLWDDTLLVWDVDTGKRRGSIDIPGARGNVELALSPDGRILAASHYTYPEVQNTITLWQLDTGRKLRSFDLDLARVRSLAFSPDGTRLVSGMDKGTAVVWDVSALTP